MASEIQNFNSIRGIAGIHLDSYGSDYRQAGAATKLIYLTKGVGFGSGKHPTTRSCLGLLESLLGSRYKPKRVLDVGTGSAVLAVAAAFLGARKIIAVDINTEAVDTARINVRINGVRGRVFVHWGDALDMRETYDLIIANLNPQQAAFFASRMEPRLAAGGYFLLSGLSGFERERALQRLAADRGLILLEEILDSGWTTLLFHKAL